MRFDMDKVTTSVAYKLLAASVMPRPIAWVVSQDKAGHVNAAPFSFFNAMGSNPPTVAIGLLADPVRGFKDTAKNVLETGEFVINLVPERLVKAMNITAVDAPNGMNELELAGLETLPSEFIKPPRIAESPVAFECVSLNSVVTGPQQTIVIGRVLAVHIHDQYVLDAENGYLDTKGFDLVARSFGSEYVRSRDTFNLDRPKWSDRDSKS
jgi:flavin reductase (DIM6/NTAB) family NADH-FMN oxidoreductase RutF